MTKTKMKTNTRFAPVGPVALMRDMHLYAPSIGGAYHLLLAHDVVENKEEWALWRAHMDIHQGGKDIHIIMDSSVIELGAPVSMDMIIEAADIVRATTIVLPDILGEIEATMDLVNDAIGRQDLVGYDLMFVPQGKTFEEYVKCLELARGFKFKYIGLPRDAHNYLPSRRDLAIMSRAIHPDKYIHLLGMSNSYMYDDFLTVHSCDGIMGIDSAVPVRAGQNDIEFRVHRTDYGPRGNYWGSTQLSVQAYKNIQYVRQLLGEVER
jgi:hypothetical protein